MAVAVAVIVLSVALCDRLGHSRWTSPLIATGRMALTLYVAHVVIGMGALAIIGRLENQSLPFALTTAIGFCVLSVLFSTWWLNRYQHGPLEWLMRKLT